MVRRLLAACLFGLALVQTVSGLRFPAWKLLRFPPGKLSQPCSVHDGSAAAASKNCSQLAARFHNDVVSVPDAAGNSTEVLDHVFAALAVLQDDYFDAVNGTWPSSIDWTGAVVETVLSGTLATLTKSLASVYVGHKNSWSRKENLISSLYAHVVHSFFGQNALALRDEAYDDMLWVVLGWLEAIKFVQLHAHLHYPGLTGHDCHSVPGKIGQALETLPWQGFAWSCTFADRARAFWDLARAGWNTSLCHGGMLWNPRLAPYKNAITNQLWISASIAMYEHFPNDSLNESWVESQDFSTNDPVYLAAAIDGYKWLKYVNMTNNQGLYVDGYHIDGSIPGNVECDVRDEMVYTYNQGVILTGQRGLWTVTGSPWYLDEGHKLILSVIEATGWDLGKNAPVDDIKKLTPGRLPPWRGIGRYGILEEQCDASGTCSQDAQAFKGIFFHHLTAFCAPVEPIAVASGRKVDEHAYSITKAAHQETCRAYLGWVKHNVEAALATRDEGGRFGMWWGAGVYSNITVSLDNDGIDHAAANTTDYRCHGTPQNPLWGVRRWLPGTQCADGGCQDLVLQPRGDHGVPAGAGNSRRADGQAMAPEDPNGRGRARTVETQAGGLALLRAYYELSQ